MPKSSQQLTDFHKNEIINACEALYENMSFKDITIKQISEYTSFTRTSIYNYFKTKEEIFLALFKREYEYWTADLNALADSGSVKTADDFARELALTLEKRRKLLKLLSMNMYDMEENSSIDMLIEFKTAYGRSLDAVRRCLDSFFPNMKKDEKDDFMSSFFPFMYGLYPYAVITDKQRVAIEKAGVTFKAMSIYDLAYTAVKKLLTVSEI